MPSIAGVAGGGRFNTMSQEQMQHSPRKLACRSSSATGSDPRLVLFHQCRGLVKYLALVVQPPNLPALVVSVVKVADSDSSLCTVRRTKLLPRPKPRVRWGDPPTYRSPRPVVVIVGSRQLAQIVQDLERDAQVCAQLLLIGLTYRSAGWLIANRS